MKAELVRENEHRWGRNDGGIRGHAKQRLQFLKQRVIEDDISDLESDT